MRPPRSRSTIKRMLIAAGILVGITIAVFPIVSRARTVAVLHATAEYHAAYADVCIRRIPEDLQRAIVFARWASEGKKAPYVFVNSGGAFGMANQQQAYRKLFMRLSEPGSPQPPNANFRGWVRESTWWATEALRDARRAAWHDDLSKRYELAASRPEHPLFAEPPEPFPD